MSLLHSKKSFEDSHNTTIASMLDGRRMKSSDFIAEFLHQKGCSCVFELAGGMTAHLMDSLYVHGGFQIVSMHHEQCVGFAADGWARMTGQPGVAIAITGPGATNLLTAVGDCYYDSIPVVFLTGQINRNEMRGDRGIRQLGFQEMEIIPMVKSITKLAVQVGSPEELPACLEMAWQIAIEGRPGPVLVDIPMDVQRLDLTVQPENRETSSNGGTEIPEVGEILNALASSSRPLILAGGGLRWSENIHRYRELIATTGLMSVHSLHGVDLLPFDDPRRVGMIGTYGNRWANRALAECDFLLVLGSRLDVRQTGADVESFTDGKVICQVDIDDSEIGNRIPIQLPLHCSLQQFFDAIEAKAEPIDRPEWTARIKRYQTRYPDVAENPGCGAVNPNVFVHQVTRASHRHASAIVVDVGQHQMWAAQSAELHAGQRFLTSGGMGAMGFALPTAIGASLATGASAIVIAGDGGFQINLQELETVASHRLPIKIAILNNRHLGMIRQFQDTYFGGRRVGSQFGYSCPDFVAVAEAFGIRGRRVEDDSQIADAVQEMWSDPESPFLLDVAISEEVNAHPKMQFGEPLSKMEPELG